MEDQKKVKCSIEKFYNFLTFSDSEFLCRYGGSIVLK